MTEVNGIPVHSEWVALKEDTKMFSEYEGRGIPPRAKIFPAGTKVLYDTFPYNGKYAARAGEKITHWVHTVRITEGRSTFRASKRIENVE